jgi:hypothetical protein
MDGQPRDANKDIGADEYSNTPILARILTTNDVGPNSIDGTFQRPQPRIVSCFRSNSSLLISGTNGVPGVTYFVLAQTNLAIPLNNWIRFSTNQFDASGNFSFTNPTDPKLPARFFLLQLQ